MSILKMKAVFLSALIALSAWAGTTVAEEAPLSAPKDRTILTVSGKISVTNKGDAAEFDRTMLEAIGMESFTTSTPWYSARALSACASPYICRSAAAIG